MSVTRCDCCKGQKEINGLGGMKKECPECYGVGYVKIEVKDDSLTEAPKRGRLTTKKE
jgi:DnaJ-class molecular chaperone